MSIITRLTPARRLARSARPLADVLVDSVRRDAAGGEDPCDQESGKPGQLDLELEDGNPAVVRPSALLPDAPPSHYAMAVLLGRALDADRAGLARLQDADAVSLIACTSAEMVEPVKALLKRYVFEPANVINLAELRDGGIEVADPGSVAVFVDRDDGRPAAAERSDELIKAARAGCALLGISSDPDRLLPPELVRLSTVTIEIPRCDAQSVRDIIRAATAKDPGTVDPRLANNVTLAALDLAVRADLGAEASLSRLRLLVDGTMNDEATVPKLSDMHGLGEAKTWALDLIADLDAYGRGELVWSAVPRGAVLWSRPGCGKTAVARALAREAGCAFIATSYAQRQAHREDQQGHVTQAIRNTFAEARQKAPAIVFIDEIDTLGTRGSSKREEDWWRAIINTVLLELDGFERREGVVVIGACNDPNRLDPALVRAGRLDRKIEIPMPDVPALAGIFRTYLGDELAGDNIIDLALVAHGGTGAEVERWIRDARGRARRADRPLTKSDLFAAVRGDRKELPDPVRRRIAFHEAGHAIAIVATGIATPRSLSIGDKGGLSLNEPGEGRALTRSHLENYLMMLLAGRAAEVLVFGEASAGAGGSEDSDLGGATRLATRLETAYGLGSSGLLFLPVDPERQFLLPPEVRGAVATTLERVHQAALDLLVRNRVLLEAIAEALFERGYLDAEAILHVVARHPLQPASGRTPIKKQAGSLVSPDPNRPDSDVASVVLRP